MTTTTISGISPTPVNLSNGDTLIVTTTGSINVSATYAVFSSSNTTCNIDNSGSIINTSTINTYVAINISGLVLNNLTNNGIISSAGDNSIFIGSGGLYLGTFTNFGTITSTGGGAYINNNYGNNPGFIAVFNNLQSGLTFSGNVPNTYNIIINSLIQYGQLFCTGNNSQMTFGIYTPSTLSVGSYTSVLTGITANQINNVTGTYGLYNWSLLVRNDGTTWDLLVTTDQPTVCISYPDPPRLWSRAMTTCITSVPVNDLHMRRKAEILKYKANSAQLTKKQKWAQLVHGGGPLAKKVWATQNDLGSNPNIENLPLVGNVLQCNGPPLVQCSPSTACDVPGQTIQLCDDPNVPLTNYIVQRTYLAGGTKVPQTCWTPGDNGFPVGKAGKMF